MVRTARAPRSAAVVPVPVAVDAPTATPIEQVFHPALSLDLIVESALNPRRRYDPKTMEELTQSIRTRGIDTPIIVRQAGDYFELAAGHRRCRAARAAGLTAVPALVRVLDDDAFVELLNVDNLQRENIDPLDEALGFQQLLDIGRSKEAIADRVSREVSYVVGRLKLLQLGNAAREALQRGLVPVTHAIEIAKLPPEQQHEVLEKEFVLDPHKLMEAYEAATSEQQLTEVVDDVDAASEATSGATGTPTDGRFPSEQLGHPFARYSYQSPRIPTIEALRSNIRSILLRRLGAAPWALDDATLLPSAGACTACPKRSGSEPGLFPELAGEDACTDHHCYAAKAKAHARRAADGDQPSPAPQARERDVQDDDDDAAPAPQRAAPSASNAEAERRRAEQESKREEAALARAQEKRVAMASALAGSIKAEHLTNPRVLALLAEEQLHGCDRGELEVLLSMFGLDVTKPEDETSQHATGWAVDRILAFLTSPKTPRGQAVAMFVMLLLSTFRELTVTRHRLREEPKQLHALIGLLKVNITRGAKTAVKKVAAKKPAKVAKKAPAKKAAKKVVKKSAKR